MIAIYLIAIASILIVAGLRGQVGEVGEIIKSDFTGKPNFLAWIVAVWFIGFIASFKQTQNLGRAFYGLLIVTLLLSNKGFLNKLSGALTGR